MFYEIRFGSLLPMNFFAAKFEKWAHIWCQLITKSDLIAGINFNPPNNFSQSATFKLENLQPVSAYTSAKRSLQITFFVLYVVHLFSEREREHFPSSSFASLKNF